MGTRDERVDAYIAGAAPFARPILERIREDFHAASARIAEDIKWGVPAFVHEGLVGGMGAFKTHVSFGFWRADELPDPEGLFAGGGGRSLFTVKVGSVADLPPRRSLQAYVKRAVALSRAGPAKPAAPKRAARTPRDLEAALRRSARARATFDALPPGARQDYVRWILEAKREATRARRIATAMEWLAEGKRRNWKYETR